MMRPRLALVTGANRGIGLEIVRQLAGCGVKTVLTARDAGKGLAAATCLRADGLDVVAAQLDVASGDSISNAVYAIEREHGPIDILINNAAILIDEPNGFDASVLDLRREILRRTFETNLEGPLHLIQAVAPGMRARGYGRIVNISSTAGQMAGMSAGFPAYRMSKAALNALTGIVAGEISEPDVKVNAMCPGWVRTDMGGPGADRSIEEGADTAIWLATLPASGPSGGFFQDRKPIPW